MRFKHLCWPFLAGLLACAACTGTNTVPVHGLPVFNFHTITTIGSVVDPINGDSNPYGLTIAPGTAGLLTAGDLVICNFNDAANVQGNGTTVVAIHPTPGSLVQRIAQSPSLLGCGSVTTLPNGNLAVTAKLANDVPVLTPAGSIVTTLSQNPWNGPWGAVFAAAPVPAMYVSNANDGSIVRVGVNGNSFTFTTIATGFSVNHGVPGDIFAPYGFSYDPRTDTLYFADGNTNRLIAFSAVSQIPANGIVVSGGGFTGAAAASARVVFSGPPLNGPLATALIANGDIVVVNESPTGDNRFMEFTPSGTLVGQKILDNGAPGGLFGIAASLNAQGQSIVYFLDDNDNTVKVLSP